MFSHWLLALFLNAGASTVLESDAHQALHGATFQAEIEILTSQAASDPRVFARTRSLARVRELFSASRDGDWIPAAGETFWLEIPGGEIGTTGVMYSGHPRAYVGHRYSAALRRVDAQIFTPVAGGQGLRDLNPSRGYSRNRTDGSDGDGTGAFLYWDPRYFPIPYSISFPTLRTRLDWADAIDASFNTWKERTDTNLDFLPMGCSMADSNQNDGINTIIYVSADWPFQDTAIAVTRNFYVAGEGAYTGMILDTDILINGDTALIDQGVAHPFSVTGEAGSHDLQNILTHEVGHFIGLGHEVAPTNNQATMYETAQIEETNKRTLEPSDIQGLLAAYSGFGVKSRGFSSAMACALSSGVFSCAAVPGQPTPWGQLPWMFAAVVLALLLGRRSLQEKKPVRKP